MEKHRNLIPHFICEQTNKKSRGRINATAMFADISGFTSLTESLMKEGKYGAEILSNILNDLFKQIENAVYSNRGYISSFAGDAFTGIFKSPDNAVNAGIILQNIFSEFKSVNIKKKSIKLSVKVGIAYGSISWGIPGKKDRYSFFFKGKAISKAAECEGVCNPGEIIIDEKLHKNLKTRIMLEKRDKYFILKNRDIVIPINDYSMPKCKKQYLFNIFHNNIISAENEFRETVNIFINFSNFTNNNSLFSFVDKIRDIADRSGGYFNTIDFGDKGNFILIVFGAPLSMGNNIERACLFIDEIREIFGLRIRAGITYGNVFAGFIGSKRCTYTVLGDTVNLAARLMGMSKYGEILCDSNLIKHASKIREFKHKGQFKVKGKKNYNDIYIMNNKLQHYISDEIICGRDKELNVFRNNLALIEQNNEPCIIILKGNTGTGKTLMLTHLESVYKNKYNIIKMRCDTVFRRSFNPFTSYMRSVFLENEQIDTFENKWDDFIEKFPSMKGKKTIIADIAGIHIKDKEYHNLPPKDKFEIKLYTLRDYYHLIANITTILMIDDMDKADNDSIMALSVIMRESKHLPYLLIVTRTNGNSEDFLKDDSINKQLINLENLSRDNIGKIIKTTLGTAADMDLINIVMKKSDGNPFFARQLISYMKENNLIDEKEGQYRIISRNTNIPSSINNILVARVDGLNQELKTAVKHASVLGVEFQTEILKNMLDTKNIDRIIDNGEKNEIWLSLSELKYIFKQGILRDAVYCMQMKKRLRELHLKAATIIKLFYPKDKSFLYQIAYHYDNAEFFDEAYHYYDKASLWAAENFRNEENRNIIQRMMQMTNDKSKCSDIHSRMADLLYNEGNLDASREYYEKSIKYAEESGNMKVLANAFMGISEILRIRSEYKECIEYADKLKLIAEKNNDYEHIIHALLIKGAINITMGKQKDAKKDLFEAENISKKYKDKNLYESVYRNLGNYCWYLGKYDKAIEYFNKAIYIAKKKHSIEHLCGSYANIGGVYWYKGDIKKAKKYYEKALNIAKKAGIKRIVSLITGNMASIYITKAEYKKAINMLNFKMKVTGEMGDRRGKALAKLNLGSIYFRKEDYKRAEELYNEVLVVFRLLDTKYGMGVTLGNLGEVYLINGKVDKAMECFMEKLDIADKANDEKMLGNTYCSIGELMLHAGDYEDALSSFERSYDIVSKLGIKKSIVDTLKLIAYIKRKQKDYKKADKHLKKALKVAKEMENKVYICKLLADIAVLYIDKCDYQKAVEFAKKSITISLQIKSGNYHNQSLMVLAEALMKNNKRKAINILEKIQSNDKKILLEKDRLLCYALKNRNICRKVLSELEFMYKKTYKAEYMEKAQEIKNFLK